MKTVLLAFSVFLLSSFVFGQQELIKSIGNNAKEKANAQDFNTTRNNKERGNLMDDKKSRQAAPVPAAAPPAPVMESEVPAPSEPSGEYQAAYTFTGSALYKMEYLQKASAGQEIEYAFGDQSVRMELRNQDQSFITDSKNGVIITLDSKNKTALVMQAKTTEAAMKQQQAGKDEKPAAKVTKTGRTKTILGYTCEEVLIESDNRKTEVWNTRETGIDVGPAFDQTMQRTMDQFPDEAFSGGGMLMEMTAYDTEGKPEIRMSVISLSKEPKVVNVGAYKITNR